jgi:Fic family protein
MKLESYSAGAEIKQDGYSSFSPSLVNHEWSWDDTRINTLLEEASRYLAELDAYSMIVPDIDLFIQMHILKEASTSSKIEGTQTFINEEIMEMEFVDPKKRNDWQEVQNYVEAMNTAINDLNNLPLSNRMLKKAHATLLKGVRGENKTPGEFRRTQNRIGGVTLKDAAYVPPRYSEVPGLMSDLEKFWHNDEINVPHLIRVALGHYQFEVIHPFQDGNGRIGRLLITLYLVSKQLLRKPSLYVSDYFEKNRDTYINSLHIAHSQSDFIQWIRFFLTAVIETAQKGISTFKEIMVLKEEMEEMILTLGRKASNAKSALALLYRKPSIRATELASHLSTTHQTATSLIRDFEDLGILREVTGYQRNKSFTFSRYLELFLS